MARKINYDNWSKEELIKELRRIKETKYGLVWHRDLPEEKIDILINPDARTPNEMFPNEMAGKPFPILKEKKSKEINGNNGKPVNLLIEGDNYHSLAVLNFTHQEAIDLIYIDPPYNTGNNDFIYNDRIKNNYVQKDDPFRHSKWLAFMEKRLKLAKKLLKPDGLIFMSIDDNEVSQLRLLADEIFEEKNFIATLPTIMNLKGNQDQFGFAGTHEYTLVYAKDIMQAKIGQFLLNDDDLDDWEEDQEGFFKKGANLKATGVNAPRSKRPNLFFPIFFSKTGDFYVADDDNARNKDDIKLLPITDNKEMSWRWSKDKIRNEKNNLIIEKNNGTISIYKKQRPALGDLPSKKPKTIFYKPEYSSGNGTAQLKELFSEKVFNNPKPINLIKDFVILASPKNGIILDFMAGSGTTGHAVLALNKEDNSNRQFILCTNNENNICTDVCYPRLKKVINGYKSSKGENVAGLGGNLKYYICDFVEAEPTDRNKRKLVSESTEMLCIRENAFELVQDEGDFKIFKNSKKYLGIVFYEEAIDDFKKAIKKINGHFNVYVFSLGDDPHEKQFADVKKKVALCAIPEVILKVYREIFK
ncbi:MAG: site-specific DNA-methyltransferase [Candidatus Moranbacteria bacterium]|nr:site-specific DNA-methyltransferase [Candidatus Moranbacteria bacterium]